VAALHGEVAVVVDGGPCTAPPSTVLDVTSTPWRILREGGISAADLGLAGPGPRATP
jgi:tRNA A37 threonylcarbamoyladenosine synthetase subunit TsaC/SUA5/YrdC